MREYCPIFANYDDEQAKSRLLFNVPDSCISCARVALYEAQNSLGRQQVETDEDDEDAWDLAEAITGTDVREPTSEIQVMFGDNRTAVVVNIRGEQLSSSDQSFTAWRATSTKKVQFTCSK